MKNLTRYFAILPVGVALRLLVLQFYRKLFLPYVKFEFSYAGESSILNEFFQYKTRGFYIDVGCNHPIRSSNTFGLYLKGWQGVAIDANKHLTDEFRRVRKKDTVVNAAISKEEKEVNFYDFDNADLLSTIDDTVGTAVQKGYHLKSVTKMTTHSLDTVLQECGVSPDQEIDLLSIDVEGLDFEVLQSINLGIYRPKLIVIECHHFDLSAPETNEVYNYLVAFDYQFVGYVSMNAYFSQRATNDVMGNTNNIQ